MVVGCGTLETRSQKAVGVNLLQYHTFDFAEAKHPSDLSYFTPTNEARVKAAIRSELEKRGLRSAEPPDLKICVYLKTKTKTFDEAMANLGNVVNQSIQAGYDFSSIVRWLMSAAGMAASSRSC